jgi:hypothetical protein
MDVLWMLGGAGALAAIVAIVVVIYFLRNPLVR